MSRYQVVKNNLPKNIILNKLYKCHKIRKSSGKLLYKITQESNSLFLEIDNVSATKRVSSNKNIPGSVANEIDLYSILNGLQVNTVATSVAKLLPLIGDKNNAGFIAAVLIDLGVVKTI